MFKMNFTYHDDTLYIYLYGNIKKKVLEQLEKKMYYYVDEYGVRDVIIDTSHITSINRNDLCDMLDRYEIEYGGSIQLSDSIYL